VCRCFSLLGERFGRGLRQEERGAGKCKGTAILLKPPLS